MSPLYGPIRTFHAICQWRQSFPVQILGDQFFCGSRCRIGLFGVSHKAREWSIHLLHQVREYRRLEVVNLV